MARNRRILLGAIIVAVIIGVAYYFWNGWRIANGSQVLTGNVIPHTKTQIAFGAPSPNRDIQGISVLDTATGSVTALTMNGGFPSFRWSPDGETLLVTTWIVGKDAHTGLPDMSGYRLNVSTATLKPEPEFNNVSVDPGNNPVSPDGKQILYSVPFPESAAQASSHIIESKSVGKDDRHTIAQGVAPAWSPDGTQIAFAGKQGTDADTEIYLMDKDGSNQRRLLQNPGIDTYPAWSSDGQHIAFISTPNDGGKTQYPSILSITDSHGKGLVNLGTASLQFGWSPTANQLAFAKLASGTDPGGICIADADSGKTQCLPDLARGGVPSWSPDGKQVVFVDDKLTVCVYDLQAQKTTCYKQAAGYAPQWRP